MTHANNLDRVFNPSCVVVVGDKKALDYMWLRATKTLAGKVYSVQIDPSELPGIEALGVPNFSSLKDIPEPIDYVICAVPRAVSPMIIKDCIEKGVGGVTLYTSGFAETGTEEGIALEKTLTEMARKAGLNLIGPNCMGIFNPSIGLRNNVLQYYGEGGPVGFISQSGTHTVNFSLAGAANGIKVSKAVSIGNAIVLGPSDYLEYLGQDPQTQVIGMYLEGMKEGRRFFRTLREVARHKTVLIWKGGATEEGARAAASHTASLAVSGTVWDALIRQCGALQVFSFDELIDVTKALLYLKPPGGNGVGLIAMTGGQSVVVSDAFSRAGLSVPILTPGSYDELSSFFNIIGGSYRNPLDISANFGSLEAVRRMLSILDRDGRVDTVIMELSVVALARREQLRPGFRKDLMELLTRFHAGANKPFLMILSAIHLESQALELKQQLMEKGIPSYPNFQRAANALKKVVDYHSRR